MASSGCFPLNDSPSLVFPTVPPIQLGLAVLDSVLISGMFFLCMFHLFTGLAALLRVTNLPHTIVSQCMHPYFLSVFHSPSMCATSLILQGAPTLPSVICSPSICPSTSVLHGPLMCPHLSSVTHSILACLSAL